MHALNVHQPVWKALDEEYGVQTEMPYARVERQEIRDLFSHIPERVLDIGCACGAVGNGLKRDLQTKFIWGLELNAQAANAASTVLDKVSRQALARLPLEDKQQISTMDTILLLDVLEHMYNPWGLLEELRHWISPHAQVIVSIPNIANAHVFKDLANNHFDYKRYGILDITHVRFFTEFGMQKMIYETGYRIKNKKLLGDAYCVDPEKYPEHAFPAWVDLGNVKILAQNYAHWLSLSVRQYVFNLVSSEEKELSEEELKMKCNPPPDTFTW